jgi:hypothetical protein
VQRLKVTQRKHWRSLFENQLDLQYFNSASLVGIRHSQIGLDPKWYIVGYARIKTDFSRVILNADLPLRPRRLPRHARQVRRARYGAGDFVLHLASSRLMQRISIPLFKKDTDQCFRRTDNSEAIRLLAANTITANVMVADANLKIVYMNKAVMTLLKEAESDIQKDLPKFSTAALIGSSIDVFHKNPAHQRKLLEA